MLNRLMALSPWIEASVRTAYWSSPVAHRVLTRLQRRRKPKDAPPPQVVDPLPRLIAALESLGVRRGDILIVHSSVDLLTTLSLKPGEVNQALLALLGPEGTLVMPAYPLFKEEPTGQGRIDADVSNLVLRYDPKRTPIWTGLLAHSLMRLPGAKRSLLPINSLVAFGAHAEAMFAHELDGERPLPCGRQSAWYYCYRHNAKVVSLGVDLAHSLTLNHVAEDSYADEWPIEGWYRDRTFEIVTPEGVIRKLIGERHPRWAMNYAERTLAIDLRRAGILKEASVDSVQLELVEAERHMAFLNARKRAHYPYFVFPFQRKAPVTAAPPAA